MDMKLKVAEYIAQAAQQSFENCALTGNDVSAMIETPPDKKMGDYARRASACPRRCAARRR